MAWLGRKTSVPYSEDERKVFEATQKIGPALLIAAAAGAVALVVWAAGQAWSTPFNWAIFLQSLGLDILVAGAAGAVGAVAGFLFGIPRAREVTEISQQSHDPAKARRAVLAANTNLERVSDWLTTLLLGATLVQIKPIAEWIGGLGAGLSSDPLGAMIPMIIVYFAALGFLGVYLMTRLYLTYALQLMLKLGVEGDDAAPADELDKQMNDALASGDAEKQRQALAGFNAAKKVGDSPKANLAAARLAARSAKDPAADADAKAAASATLLQALGKVAADPTAKAALKSDADFQGLDDDLQKKVDAVLADAGTETADGSARAAEAAGTAGSQGGSVTEPK